jgi:predicted transcriptional regulator
VQVLPIQNHRITINPGKNVVYMSYYSIMYEMPVIFNRSRAVYVNSLYALDNNGTLLWKQPLDNYVTHAVAGNDTFYYSTDSGRIGGNTVNVAAGIALIAAAYVFLRFFIIGAVARARTKIESNRNRNDLLKFINENPGVTAVDISRGLKMNLGTVRYHLFILAANHKIVPYKDNGKFLRYFRNSGAYSPEERSWLSLLRREPIRKVIAALERNPGQSLQELARELEMSPTAVHNHISELSARGIVDRAQGDERGFAYTIKEEYRPLVARTIQRL